MHQCYYCDQIFDSKEDLYQHSEIHSERERTNEIKDRQKKLNKNQPQKITKKKQSKSQNKSNLDEHIII